MRNFLLVLLFSSIVSACSFEQLVRPVVNMYPESTREEIKPDPAVELTVNDKKYEKEAFLWALQNGGTGQRAFWRNPETGAQGWTFITGVKAQPGVSNRFCKSWLKKQQDSDSWHQFKGYSCQSSKADWLVHE